MTTRVQRIFFYTLGATFSRYYTEGGRASSGIRDPTLDEGRCATKMLIALKKKLRIVKNFDMDLIGERRLPILVDEYTGNGINLVIKPCRTRLG